MHNYSLIEKLSIVKSLDEIIVANDKIEPGEERMLIKIMNELDFNALFVDEARKMTHAESISVLKRMPLKRKRLFAELMHRVAISDGNVDEYETNLIIDIYREVDIDIESPGSYEPEIDLSFLDFESSKYFDYPDGPEGNRYIHEVPKHIMMEPVVNTQDEYSLVIYDSSENSAVWGKEVTFKPIRLRIKKNADDRILLVSEAFGGTNVSIDCSGPEIEKVEVSTNKPYTLIEYVI